MARYRTTIHSSWTPEAAYTYMANFANAQQWDPGVQSAQALSDGPVGLGSRFLLQATFGKSTMPLEYVIAAYEPARRVVLVAETDKVKSTDIITFVPSGSGCDVTYDAELRTLGSFRWATPIVAMLFKGIGDRARDSLRAVLTQ